MNHKVISKKGGLTIPADIRRDLNAFQSGDPVDITSVGGKIIIAPHTKTCIFCRDVRKVVDYLGRCVCQNCIKELGAIGRRDADGSCSDQTEG